MSSSTFPPPTLAIDYGRKRLGLAVSRASLAEPLKVITSHDNLWERLRSVCRQEQVAQVVVGVSEGASAAESRHFQDKLRRELDVPILEVDETLSSNQVRRKLKAAGRQAKLGRDNNLIDHYAAAEFLQEWLDSTPQEEI